MKQTYAQELPQASLYRLAGYLRLQGVMEQICDL